MYKNLSITHKDQSKCWGKCANGAAFEITAQDDDTYALKLRYPDEDRDRLLDSFGSMDTALSYINEE